MGFTVHTTLDLNGLRKLEKSCKGINKKHIKFGWIDGKSYPASSDNKGTPIATIAAKHEFGTGVAQRPYFRQTIDIARRTHRPEITNIFLNVLYGTNTVTSLEKLSNELVKDYSESVLRQNYKALDKVTIAIKGHSYQMDDTGVMIQNFKSKVYRTSLNSVKG